MQLWFVQVLSLGSWLPGWQVINQPRYPCQPVTPAALWGKEGEELRCRWWRGRGWGVEFGKGMLVSVSWGRCSSCQSVCVYEKQFKDVSMFTWRWILWKSNVWKSGFHALHRWMFHLVCLITTMGNVQYSVALHFCIPYFFSSTFGKSYLWEIKCVGHVSVFHWVWLCRDSFLKNMLLLLIFYPLTSASAPN